MRINSEPQLKPRRMSRGKSPARGPVRRRRLGLAAAAVVAGMLILVLGGVWGGGSGGRAAGASTAIRLVRVNGIIDPLIADFVTRNIEEAEQAQARAVILELDTPGGLDESMRDIVKRMTASPLPVAAYVAPTGARAASAGTFIMMASDLAAMAPGTNLGAAHPVAIGVDADSTEGIKITNDSAAYIRSLADANGRNANWAELAVRQSVALSVEDALQQQVIDMMAGDLDELVQKMNGFQCRAKGITIDTQDATIEAAGMTLKENFLHFILNPNVAYFLFLYGMLALVYEFVHPGIGFGAISGIISLLLSFYALRVLPVSFTGLALVVVGVALLAADLFITSHGALSAGGIIAIILGSLFLFDAPFLRVSLPLNLTLAALAGAFFLIAARKVMKARRLPVQTGQSAMIGAVGYSRTALAPLGQVFVHGEIWSAEAPEGETIEKGEEIEVTDVKGLMLKVKKTE